MKNITLTTAIALCGFGLASCSRNRHVAGRNPGCPGPGVKIVAANLPVCANTPKFAEQWDKAKFTKNHPIVDVHTHLFNARSLPLKRIVKSRMWVKWPASALTLTLNAMGVMDAAAALLATCTPETKEEIAKQQAKVTRYLEKHGMNRNDDYALFRALTHSPVHDVHLDNPLQSSSRGSPDDLGPLAYLSYKVLPNKFMVNQLLKWLTHEPKAGTKKDHYAATAIAMMSAPEKALERLGNCFRPVDLFVYQNMDLVPSFYAKTTHAHSYSYEYPKPDNGRKVIGELPIVRDMCRKSDGRLIYFVAWNPFRELNWKPGHIRPIDIVKREIGKGAAGVKFYPPLGYRPHCNDFNDYKRPFYFSQARLQWDNRYLGNDPVGRHEDIMKVRAECMDQVNDELFTYCEKNDIPIFTHCNTGEFRAFYTEEYGENANPAYWKPVLEKHPKLRLCFGHAGGITGWYTGCVPPTGHIQGAAKWGGVVRELCLIYRNVYCEFGIHEDVADVAMAEHLYHTLIHELPRRGAGGWTLGDKVMYGSDYYMPVGVTPKEYLEGFQQLFSLRELKDYKARFFSGNAMKYLKRKVANRQH